MRKLIVFGILLDGVLEQCLRLFGLTFRFVDTGEHRHGILVRRLEPHGMLRVRQGTRRVLELDSRRGPHGEQSGIVGVLHEAGTNRLQGLVGSAAERIQQAETHARRHIVGVRVDGALIELRGLADVAELLVDDAVVVAGGAVERRDLQRVAEFDARLFEIFRGQERLAFLDVSRLARFGAPTARDDEHRAQRHQADWEVPGGAKHMRYPTTTKGRLVYEAEMTFP